MLKTIQLILLIFLVVCFGSCKRTPPRQQAKDLILEGNKLLQQDSKIVAQWTAEYRKVFTPENLAKFPANRDWLRTQADKLIALFEESSSLSRQAAEKYEQASTLSANAQERRGVALFASSLRKNVEVNQLMKSQMKLVSDEEIKDQKTFDERFKRSWEVVIQKRRESEDDMNQGRRLLGI